MAVLFAPTEIPGPSSAPLTPLERRLLSDVPGPTNSRLIQRDYAALQRFEWLFKPEEAETFNLWWKNDLVRGGAWFSSTWPLPYGWDVAAVRRFVGPPTWTAVPGGAWRVTAVCEIRGLSLDPQGIDAVTSFLDNFNGTASTPLNAHTPDSGPPEFEWVDDQLVLDGAGSATPSGSVAGPFGVESNIGWTIARSFPFQIEFVCTVPEEVDTNTGTGATGVQIGFGDDIAVYLEISVYNFPDLPKSVSLEFVGITVDDEFFEEVDSVTPVTILLDFTETDVTVTINGDVLATLTGDFSAIPGTGVGYMNIYAGIVETEDDLLISSISRLRL